MSTEHFGLLCNGKLIPVPSSDTWNTTSAESLDIPQELTRRLDEVYALEVKDTSVIDALIDNRDIVLTQQASTAEDVRGLPRGSGMSKRQRPRESIANQNAFVYSQ